MDKNTEIKALRALLNKGKIFINYGSIDCDGVSMNGTTSFDTMEEFEKFEEDFIDGLEGPGDIKIVNEDEVLADEDCGSIGQGWDIN